MRADGIMPLSPNFSVQKVFDHAITHHLKKNNFIVFYPEQAMWHMYEKPRPFKNGAFHYAVKNNVPILPLFITLEDSGMIEDDGLPLKNFTVHIMPPLFPDKNLTKQENIENMRITNYNLCKDKYEEVYGIPLKYNTTSEVTI